MFDHVCLFILGVQGADLSSQKGNSGNGARGEKDVCVFVFRAVVSYPSWIQVLCVLLAACGGWGIQQHKHRQHAHTNTHTHTHRRAIAEFSIISPGFWVKANNKTSSEIISMLDTLPFYQFTNPDRKMCFHIKIFVVQLPQALNPSETIHVTICL